MEYPSINDYLLTFKAIFSDENEFQGYILINYSSNYKNITKKKTEDLLGKQLSELYIDDDILIVEDLYYHMVPNTKRKFERYIEELDRWYLINLFSETKDYLHVIFTDITRLKEIRKSEIDNKILFSRAGESMINYDFIKDRLTGLYTKEYFEAELYRLDTERQLPISIIIGDLNGLKLINDAFGHHMGDEALKAIGKIMKDTFRKEDIVSRFRGDEFVVLLPITTEETALSIIERLKLALDGNPLEFLKLSMSFGTASKNDYEEDIWATMKFAEEHMYFNKILESKEAKCSMIEYIQNKLDKVSFETKEHCKRLEYYSFLLAEQVGLSEIDKEKLRLLCEYHDIGKAGVPNYILNKKDPLKDDEWKQVKRHNEIGYHIMKASGESLEIDELILMHHERWDGKGYLGLLKGDEIPIVVRIFSIAEAFEAMVNHRPYKGKLSTEEALKEIEDKASRQFDPEFARIFIEIIKSNNLKAI